MNNRKGKGRATGDEDGDKGQPEEQPSMLSRVAISATGLTRSAFARPTNNELNERAAAALADSGKGQIGQPSSSSGNSAWAESSKRQQQNASQANSAGGFRVGHSAEHIRKSENEFFSFLNDIDSFTPSEDTGVHFASGGLEDGVGEAWARSLPASNLPTEKPVYGSVSEQQSRDGEDILAILSQKGNMEETFEPPQEDENFDWGLSAEQLSQLRTMTRDLFPSAEAHGAINPGHPLNLTPNFEGAYGQPPTGSGDWREQWDGVLNRYTDEVWGGLLPLVKEARREVKDIRNDPSNIQQPKALRRLGAILGHLRKY